MTIVYLLLAVLGGFIIVRSAALLFAAEIGRKHDLIKHVYRGSTDLQIAVMIPFPDSARLGALQELIQALSQQDYPANRIGIHVVASEDSAFGFPNPENLASNLKLWTTPMKEATRGQLVSWGVERLLAAGGPSRVFVFLDADDIVRQDYLRNVASRAFDCFVMQGYVALKRPPRGIWMGVAALSTRLINRIENAGRFHLGLSCRLMSSGWAVRQEILEMLPFEQGQDIDNLEYTVMLNLNNYRVHWAPNVVVYKDEKVAFLPLVQLAMHSVVNRLRLAVRFGLPLLFQGVSRLDFNALEQAWGLVKPPNFVIGLIALLGAGLTLVSGPSPSIFYGWSLFMLAFAGLQLVSLAVARCSLRDVMLFVGGTPIVYAVGILLAPFMLVSQLLGRVMHLALPNRGQRIGRRFDESQPAVQSGGRKKPKKRHSKRLLPFSDLAMNEGVDMDDEGESYTTIQTEAQSTGFDAIYQEKLVEESQPAYTPQAEPLSYQSVDTSPTPVQAGPSRNTITLPITNGKNSVGCTIHTITEEDGTGQLTYYLVFEYKSLTFTTQRYRILDQAFYELQTRLREKGFSIVSCGSCGYFYRPTAGNVRGVARDHGYCLFGKEGREIDFDADAVSVVTPSCVYYVDQESHPDLVQKWQDSLEHMATR